MTLVAFPNPTSPRVEHTTCAVGSLVVTAVVLTGLFAYWSAVVEPLGVLAATALVALFFFWWAIWWQALELVWERTV